MDYSRLIPIMRRLALEAGDRIMEVYNGPDFEVKSKSDASPVTVADEAADALISAGLREAFPDVVLITEEQAASHALSAKTFLIVDPLGWHQGIRAAPRRLYRQYRLCGGRRADAGGGLCAGAGSIVLHPCTMEWRSKRPAQWPRTRSGRSGSFRSASLTTGR